MKLSIIIPCLNEEEMIPIFFKEVTSHLEQLPVVPEYIFIDDGSTDQTLAEIKKLHDQYPDQLHFVSFSRNFGKEAAIYAGLQASTGDLVCLMDADLQDPPRLLKEMYTLITEEGYDCVGTKRTNRQGEPYFRSFFANRFYKLMQKVSKTPIELGERDFRMMNRQVVDSVLTLTEYNRFSKGLFNWVGFKKCYLSYDNQERVAGETSWSFIGLVKYSLEALIDFSDMPLTFVSLLGIGSCVLSGLALLFIVIRTLINGDPTPGWPSLVCIILFVGGLQLLSLGIVGKYISKIFLETKKRPIYLIRETDKVKEK